MTADAPVFNQLNLVVQDMAATRSFYGLLGLTVPSGERWHDLHAEVPMANGTTLEFDSPVSAGTYNAGMREPGDTSKAVIGFGVSSREAVDELYATVVAAGYVGRQEPHDAFWGARYAIVADPDGNDVGLMSPISDAHKGKPPPELL
jgi:predicted lactoylglutathione lyase